MGLHRAGLSRREATLARPMLLRASMHTTSRNILGP